MFINAFELIGDILMLERYKLYIEKMDIVDKFILFDFISEKEYLDFKYNGDVHNEMIVGKREPTMILLKVEGIKEKTLKEGDVVSVKRSKMFELKKQLKEENDHTTIAFCSKAVFNFDYLDIKKENISLVEKDPAKSDSLNEFSAEIYFDSIFKYCNKFSTLEIIDVGQGNWNRVYNENCELNYDFGASMKYSESKCKEILSNNNCLNKDMNVLVISHWDVDHYQLIQVLEDEKLECFDFVVVPMKRKTLTAERVYDRLRNKCKNFNYISNLNGKYNKLSRVYKNDKVCLMVGNGRKKNINLNGIAMIIYGENSAAFLTADHNYNQIWDFMLNLSNAGSLIHIVVPHHGGLAGYRKIALNLNAGDAIVSTGQNSYGHPREEIRQFMGANLGFNWKNTNYEGNVSIEL